MLQYQGLYGKDKANYLRYDTLMDAIDHIPDLKIRKSKDNDIAMLFKILYHCALRPGEAIRINKEDIDLANREIYLGKTKTNKEDYVVIPGEFVQELHEYLQTKATGRLFPGLKYKTFWTWLCKLGEICDIPAWTIPEKKSGEKTKGHIFRKTMGKDMMVGEHGEAAKDITVISKHMRHSSIATTMNSYLKAQTETVKEAF